MTIRLKMLQTKPGSDDGLTACLYIAGRIYECGENLGRTLIAAGFAEIAPDNAAVDVAQPLTAAEERQHARWAM